FFFVEQVGKESHSIFVSPYHAKFVVLPTGPGLRGLSANSLFLCHSTTFSTDLQQKNAQHLYFVNQYKMTRRFLCKLTSDVTARRPCAGRRRRRPRSRCGP